MTLDFEQEALVFARQKGRAVESTLVKKAMERGAEIALAAVTEQLRGLNAENAERMRVSLGYQPHGQNNGTLAGS